MGLQRLGLVIVILLVTLLAACAGPGSESDPATGTTAATECPSALTYDRGLCVADGDEAQRAAELIRSAYVDGRMGALIVGAWRGDQPVVTGALGDSMTGVPATLDMHHRIGNVSAPFITTLFMQLVDEGVLSLDDRLSQWFPEVPGSEGVTLADLTRSMSGYRHHPATKGFLKAFYADPFREWNPARLIDYGTKGGPEFPPGTDWNFSDTNMLLLGEVITKETGTSAHELITRRLIEPLGLDNTTSPTTAQQEPPVLHGFTDERGVWEDSTFWNPSWVPYGGDMASNQEDVASWLRTVASGDLLTEESFTEFMAPATVGFGPNTKNLYYAMGFGVTNGWVFCNPSLQGYSAAAGSNAGQDVTIVSYATRRKDADQDARPEQAMFVELGELLAPAQPPKVPLGN